MPLAEGAPAAVARRQFAQGLFGGGGPLARGSGGGAAAAGTAPTASPVPRTAVPVSAARRRERRAGDVAPESGATEAVRGWRTALWGAGSEITDGNVRPTRRPSVRLAESWTSIDEP